MIGANIGNTGKAGPVDTFLAVVRMFDDLRDPERRAAVFGQFEAEHAKLEKARADVEALVADRQVIAANMIAKASENVAQASAMADKIVADAKAEAERLVGAANDYTKSQNAAIDAERTKVNGERALALADKEAAAQALAQARDLADKAAADRAEAEKALAEARRIQAENERKAKAAEQYAATLR